MKKYLPLIAIILTALAGCGGTDGIMYGPNKKTTAILAINEQGHPALEVVHGGKTVPITLGLELAGADDLFTSPGRVTKLGAQRYEYSLPYLSERPGLDAVRYSIPFDTGASVEVAMFDNAVAFRYILPADRPLYVNGENTSFCIPDGTRVWFFERNNAWKLKSHAGEWISADIGEMETISSQGPVQGLPLVMEFTDSTYGFIAESDLIDYSGLRLKAVGENTFTADFTEGEKGFTLTERNHTPWRVVYFATSLDDLVNQQVTFTLATPPDQTLFGDTDWIAPGKSVWRYGTLGTGSPTEEKEMIDCAALLGCDYTLIDEGWEKWPDKWTALREVCEYGNSNGIGVWVWKRSAQIADTTAGYNTMRMFMDSLSRAGVCGIKIDFMDSEAKQWIDFDIAALRTAAALKMMVNFHGCQKPSGELVTFPHEMTREGIRGLELNYHPEGPITAAHNAALPFTRLLLGPGDYTPLSFTAPGATTWAHQLATLVCFYSPFQCLFDDPQMLTSDSRFADALPFIRDVPAVWDEIRVLEPSKIGEMATIARRSGDLWYIGGLNGGGARSVEISLDFLPANDYVMELFRDDTDAAPVPANLRGPRPIPVSVTTSVPYAYTRQTTTAGNTHKIEMAGGGGFAILLKPVNRQ